MTHNYRHMGAVFDSFHDNEGTLWLRLWIGGGVTHEDGDWMIQPAEFPDELTDSGCTFDVTFPDEFYTAPQDGTYVAQEYGTEGDDYISVSMAQLRKLAKYDYEPGVQRILDEIDPTIRDPFAAGRKVDP